MGSGSWANAGAGFGLTNDSSSARRTPSQTTHPSQARGKSTGTQLRLRPPDKRPVVTPRATTSAFKPSQKQARLPFIPPTTSSRCPLADKANRRDSPAPSSAAFDRKGKGRALSQKGDLEQQAEDAVVAPLKKPGWLSSIFRRSSTHKPGESSSSSGTSSRIPRSTGVGRAILDPSLPRHGPTIDFDADLPADDDELAGEKARRKRRRTEDHGGWGRLDLCDEGVHAGFGTQRDELANERRQRSLEMVLDRAPDEPHTSACARTSQRGQLKHIEVLPDSQPDEALPASASAYFTARGPSGAAPAGALILASSSAASGGDEPSTASSSDSSAERSLQTHLVQPSSARRAPRVLVPDSDPPSGPEDALTEDDDDGANDELDALVARLGPKGAVGVDDSGFAEGEMEVHHERPRTPTSTPENLDELDLTVIPSSSPLPAPALLGAPSPAKDDDEQPSSGSLARTASAVLMPPPAIPRKRLRRGAPSTRAAAAEAEAAAAAEQARVLVEDTQIRSPTRAAVLRRDESQPYAVLCDETQTQAPAFVGDYRMLPRLPRPANLPGAGTLSSPSNGGEPLSDPDHLPPLPTPRPLAVPLSPAPMPFATAGAGGWASLAAAWAGARPPSPATPSTARQTRLGEFFDAVVVPGSQVEDSQGDCDVAERELEVALRAQLALNAARERARTRAWTSPPPTRVSRALEDVVEDDVVDADAAPAPARARADLEIDDPDEEVPDSDPEDDPPSAFAPASASACTPHGGASPLGTPVKARFPRYSPGKMRRAIARFAPSAAPPPPPLPPAAGQDAGGETQWESYWSYPDSASSSSPHGEGTPRETLHAGETAERRRSHGRADEDDDDADDDEDSSLALPSGWARGANGELVRVGEAAEAGEAGEAEVRGDAVVEDSQSWEDTLTGW
ncbi:hypothetical protein JCM3770_004935 [Rhodotorula araucariae]